MSRTSPTLSWFRSPGRADCVSLVPASAATTTTVATTTAATAVAAATAAATAVATTAAAAARPVFPGLGFVDSQGAAAEEGAVHGGNGFIATVRHLHEGETAAAPGFAIGNN